MLVVTDERTEKLFKDLGYSKNVVTKSTFQNLKSNPQILYLSRQIFQGLLGVDAVYYTGTHPVIYFKSLNSFDAQIIKDLHRKVWNEGRVPLLFIITPTQVKIINAYAEPLKRDELAIDKLELGTYGFAKAAEDYISFRELYHQRQIDSGEFWKSEIGQSINTSKAVDQLLLGNLKATRKKLHSDGITLSHIHNVLSRSLFILYLEDRGVIKSTYYSRFLKDARCFFDLLNSKTATYKLFKNLNAKFNGDLFAISKEESETISAEHLALVRRCFYGDDLKTGQLHLGWKVFDFNYIPIELLSSIYEEFMHTEEGIEESSNAGAFYTPHALVEFVLNEILPYPDDENLKYDFKVLDPACGSGIFLVEAYKRIIERYKAHHGLKRVSFPELRTVLTNSIFGVEKNPEAIKVAAFSLYLSMLHYMEPKHIWTTVKFPPLVQSPNRKNKGDNLFEGDTFKIDVYLENTYNIIIGNPPWKHGDLETHIATYLKEHGFAQELVLAFLHKMACIAPDAKIGLVSAAKILFNKGKPYQKFREFLFHSTYVEAIINFALIRKAKKQLGRKLFPTASGPACVIFYQKNAPIETRDNITYCIPKPDRRDSAFSALVIDASDVKYLPRDECKDPKSNVWKVAMFGTMRDLQLIKRLQNNTLLEFFNENKNIWEGGVGFQTSNPKDKPDLEIKEIPFIDASRISRYYTLKDSTTSIEDTMFRRIGTKEAYQAPHLLIKEGFSNNRFCASYLDYEAAFTSTVYGLHSQNKDQLKALCAYFNSAFATYFFFLTASTWGVERERVKPNEIFELPALSFLFDDDTVGQISGLVDEIIKMQKIFSLEQADKICAIERKIDNYIYKTLKFSDDDVSLITNVLDFQLDYFQTGNKSLAIAPVNLNELIAYANKIAENLSLILDEELNYFGASIIPVTPRTPLAIVAIHFNATTTNNSGTQIKNSTDDFDKLLRRLDKQLYEKYAESIYFRKIFVYNENNTRYIVKPNEKRFWTHAVALEDSDSIAVELIDNTD